MADETGFYTTSELAKLLGCGLNTAYSIVRSGQIPCIKIGKQYRVPRKEFWEFVKANPKLELQTKMENEEGETEHEQL